MTTAAAPIPAYSPAELQMWAGLARLNGLPADTPIPVVWAKTQEVLRLNAWMGPYARGEKAPSIPQLAFLLDSHKEVLFGGATKGGKMLRVDEPIPTPDGWTTMGALRAGDQVCDEQGQPCTVLAAHPVDLQPVAYRLTFDDGTSIEACADHLWLTYDTSDLAALTRRDPGWRAARQARRPSRALGRRSPAFTAAVTARNKRLRPPTMSAPTGTVRTTQTIAETLRTASGRANHAIPVAGALDCPERPLPIDPYLLGAWLGDGHSTASGFTSADPFVMEQFVAAGVPVASRASADRPYAYLLGAPILGRRNNGRTALLNDWSAALRALGVWGNKHIPPAYLRASRTQRLDVLRGLMDTDGTVDKDGGPEFTTTSPALADGFYELVVSLGWKVSRRERRAKLAGRDCGPKWVFKFTPDQCVFRLPRKAERQRLAQSRKVRFRYIVACDRVPSSPMRCITVDSPSHLYLAGRSMIPTHNTDAFLLDMLKFVDVPHYQALVLDRSFPNLMRGDGIIHRFLEWVGAGPPGVKWDAEGHAATFPSGAMITFGFIERPEQAGQYKRANYQRIYWEELTEHPPGEKPTAPPAYYTYLYSRLARPADSPIPLAVRGNSNPDGPGRLWVKHRWGLGHDEDGQPLANPEPAKRHYIPATYRTNPGIDPAEVAESLSELGAVAQAQLGDGDWDEVETGHFFQVEQIRLLTPEQLIAWRAGAGIARRIRGWDKAGTDASEKSAKRAKFTVGLRVARVDPRIYGVGFLIEDCIRRQWGIDTRDRAIRETAGLYDADVPEDARLVWTPDPWAGTLGTVNQAVTTILIEQEPADAGKQSARISVDQLAGREVKVVKPSQDKETRARNCASQVNAGNYAMVPANWNGAVLDELKAFSAKAKYKDIVDTLAMIHNELELVRPVPPPASSRGTGRTLPASPDWAPRRPLLTGRGRY